MHTYRWILLLLWGAVLGGGSVHLYAQQVVSSDSLLAYASTDKPITVCDQVSGGFKSKTNTVFLNFGAKYPKQKFTVVIFAKSLAEFPYSPVEKLKDKYVCVKGKVKIYKEKPEIIIFSPKDIQPAEEILLKEK